MSVRAKAVYFLRTALLGIRRTLYLQGLAILAMTVILFSLGLIRGTWKVLDGVWLSVQSQVEFTVYVAPEMSDAQQTQIQRQLAEISKGRAVYVSSEDALLRIKKELGDAGTGLDRLQENPLTPSFEVYLPIGNHSLEALSAFAKAMRQLPLVTDVDYRKDAVERLWKMSEWARTWGYWAVVIAVFLATFLMAAIMQLAMHSRKEEIEIQQWVGATNGFVRAPFLMEGVLQGGMGALLAYSALGLLAQLSSKSVTHLFAFLQTELPVMWLDKGLLLEMVGAGMGVGLVGSFIAVGRFLRA